MAENAGVAFVIAEIVGLNIKEKSIFLKDRPSIGFEFLSLDVGSETKEPGNIDIFSSQKTIIPIKPFSRALQWIQDQDKGNFKDNDKAITVLGTGLSAVEVVLALRARWPDRPLSLQVDLLKLNPFFRPLLFDANIALVSRLTPIPGPTLLCTGSKAPSWIQASNLPLDSSGRILTTQTLQVLHNQNLFAVGDCGVIKNHYRPASGVWAVRAANTLARNLERCSQNLKPYKWRPQKRALQLIGAGPINSKHSVAWGGWGNFVIGPYHFLWRWKQFIDKRFMEKFDLFNMDLVDKRSNEEMACRGCAAKLPSGPLREALKKSELTDLARSPEDAALIASLEGSESFFQSVDGFPALISDSWLNGRLTALHASSDIWAMGASVSSAQVAITLPKVSVELQKEFLTQSLSGINSALKEQGAKLIGGHTIEARNDSPYPFSLGIQIAISVNGSLPRELEPLKKGGLHLGDDLLISRALGSGVLFAAARVGKSRPHYLDDAIEVLSLIHI